MTEIESKAQEKFSALREVERQWLAAAIDTQERHLLGKERLTHAEAELAEEVKRTRGLHNHGQKVTAHPDKVNHADKCRGDAERLAREAAAASERWKNIAALLDRCRQILAERGIDPERETPRRSNAVVVIDEPTWFEQQRREAGLA